MLCCLNLSGFICLHLKDEKQVHKLTEWNYITIITRILLIRTITKTITTTNTQIGGKVVDKGIGKHIKTIEEAVG